jgi:hypothetical protein
MRLYWLAIGLTAAAVLAIIVIVIVIICTPKTDDGSLISGNQRGHHTIGKSQIERVIPGFLNTFLFTYYASEYRALVDGIEFCCDTPIIEHVIWPESKPPPVQQGKQTIACSLVIRLPKGRQTRSGHTRTFRNVSLHVPIEIEFVNR